MSFQPGPAWKGNAAQTFRKGHPFRWQPGQSGNPGGKPKARRDFEESFYAALMGQGTPEEAAKLLWESARAKEAWAVQLLLQRLAPMESKFKLEVSRGDDEGFDPTRLSDEQLEQLTRLMELASGQAPAIESGTDEAESETVHPGGVADS
jgi:hypothetical protein